MNYSTDNPKLSVIMPFVNEGIGVVYTMQQVLDELRYIQKNWGNDVELVLINNWCKEAAKQHMKTTPCCNKAMTREDVNLFMYKEDDKWGKKVASYCNGHRELKYYTYTEKLSHWNAKNIGINASGGDNTDILFFCDAHCFLPPHTLCDMYSYFVDNRNKINGSLHLPLAYFLDRLGRRLIYKTGGHCDTEKGLYHYSFTPYTHPYQDKHTKPFTTRAMSTCGMMMDRGLFATLGGWPTELGVYGGGENFINYTLAILGYNKCIFPTMKPLYHEGKEKRGYNFYGDDYNRNRLIATYMFGGEELMKKYAPHCKGGVYIDKWTKEIVEKCKEQRKHIQQKQVHDIEWWFENFKPEIIE